jgi:hypothetical protein
MIVCSIDLFVDGTPLWSDLEAVFFTLLDESIETI